MLRIQLTQCLEIKSIKHEIACKEAKVAYTTFEMLNLTEEQTIELLYESQFEGPLSILPTFSLTAKNPVCGDLIKADVLIVDNQVAELAINASGCVLSRIATEIWGRTVIGKSTKEVLLLPERALLNQVGEVIPMRIGCALLFFHALRDRLASWGAGQ